MTKNINTKIILNNTLINNYESATIKELRIQLNKMDNKSSLDSNGFNKYIHDSMFSDNLLAKIQIHFLTFSINVSNDAIKTELGHKTNYNFKNINYSFKRKISYKYFKNLLKYSLKNILVMDISPKYTNYNLDQIFYFIILNIIICSY